MREKEGRVKEKKYWDNRWWRVGEMMGGNRNGGVQMHKEGRIRGEELMEAGGEGEKGIKMSEEEKM